MQSRLHAAVPARAPAYAKPSSATRWVEQHWHQAVARFRFRGPGLPLAFPYPRGGPWTMRNTCPCTFFFKKVSLVGSFFFSRVGFNFALCLAVLFVSSCCLSNRLSDFLCFSAPLHLPARLFACLPCCRVRIAGSAAVHGHVARRLPHQRALRQLRVRLLRGAPGGCHAMVPWHMVFRISVASYVAPCFSVCVLPVVLCCQILVFSILGLTRQFPIQM